MGDSGHMATINFRYQYSHRTLWLIVLLGVLLLTLLTWQWELVYDIYFREQLTRLGWLINGAIIALFLTGMAHIVLIVWHYRQEEASVAQFLRNLQQRPERPLRGIDHARLIAQRYDRLQALYDAQQPIDQSALAATLMASESIRQGVPKFVNNTLILTGVFGTIVSLSMALVGASETLENAVSATGMGMVIHGMSTALSTTITAIVCYFYFAYFFARVSDAQTNLVGAIEQITTLHLLPRFQVDTEHVLYEFAGLIRSLQGLAEQMQQTQAVLTESEHKVLAAVQAAGTTRIQASLEVIMRQLRTGFRLRDDE